MSNRNKEYHAKYQREYYFNRRNRAIKVLGNECSVCGSMEKLNFDHIDPYNKNFSVSRILKLSWNIVLEELKKCQLLCEKCHKSKSKIDGSTYKGAIKGEKHPSAKLTEYDIYEIRQRLKEGDGVRFLGRVYNVDHSTISHIKNKHNWTHI